MVSHDHDNAIMSHDQLRSARPAACRAGALLLPLMPPAAAEAALPGQLFRGRPFLYRTWHPAQNTDFQNRAAHAAHKRMHGNFIKSRCKAPDPKLIHLVECTQCMHPSDRKPVLDGQTGMLYCWCMPRWRCHGGKGRGIQRCAPNALHRITRGVPVLPRRRTPHALHRVRGPSGPQRHWGVWCAAQFRHVMRLALRPAPA